MFSRKTRRTSALWTLLLSLVLTSCSLPLNEDPAKQEKQEANLDFDTACLSDVFPVSEAFWKGTAQPAQVAGLWDCFGGAIDLFYRKVKGADRDTYGARELATFFEDYFLNDIRLNDRMLEELMRFKSMLVGGSRTHVTRAEMRELTEFAKEAREMSLQLLPYMPVFSGHWKPYQSGDLDNDLRHFNKANQQAQEVLERLGERILASGQSYEMAHFLRFIEEAERLSASDWAVTDKLHEMMPLVQKLKKSLVGGREDVITAQEWPRFALLGVRGYLQYLRFSCFIRQAPEDQGSEKVMLMAESADDLFSYLSDMVRGKQGGRLEKTELVEVATALKAVIPDLQITEGLIGELMKVKQLILGGSAEHFLPEEFDQFRGQLGFFRDLATKAYPYLKIYTLDWDPKNNPGDANQVFADAEKNLVEIAEKLAGRLQNSYDLTSLERLANEMSPLLPPKTPEAPSWGKSLNRYMPALVAVKRVVLNDSSSTVARTQWPVFLGTAARAYGRFMQYKYFLDIDGLSWMRGGGLHSLHKLSGQSLDLLEKIIQSRGEVGNAVIRFDELDYLINAFEKSDLLPAKLNSDILNSLTRVLLKRFLMRPEKRLNGMKPSGLGMEATLVARNELNLWFDGQDLIERLYPSDPQSGVTGSRIVEFLGGYKENTAARELRMVLRTPVPLTFDRKGRFYQSLRNPIRYRAAALDKINLARASVRLINRAYVGDMDRIQEYAGFGPNERDVLFADLKPIAVRMGLLEPESTTFAVNRFREANLFAPHADGNMLLSFREGVDLFLLILSGVKLDSEIQDAFQGNCKTLRISGDARKRVSKSCFLSVYRNNFTSIFTSMPDFVAGMDPLPREAFDEMSINFLKATGWIDDKTGTVILTDTSLVPHAMQYVETLFSRFDADADGFINREEAFEAYPLFRATILSVSPMDGEDILQAGYAFILVKGRIPQSDEYAEFFLHWVKKPHNWHIRADRNHLASVLGFISDAMAEQSAKPKKKKGGGLFGRKKN